MSEAVLHEVLSNEELDNLIFFLDKPIFKYSVEFLKSAVPSIWMTVMVPQTNKEVHVQIFGRNPAGGEDYDGRVSYSLYQGEDVIEIGRRSFSGLFDFLLKFFNS